jgi:hypothetical protein
VPPPVNGSKEGCYRAGVRSLALLLLVPVAAVTSGCRAEGAGGRHEPAAPVVTIVAGVQTRVAVRCASGHVELEGGVVAYGGRGHRDRAFGQIGRGDASASCVDDGGKAQTRLQPLVLRSIGTRAVKDAAGVRVVLTLDGQALGPFGAADDGMYLVWPTGLVRADAACPEQRVDRNRVVACVTAAQLAGRGPARLRLQSAGRLDELGGAPLDLGTLL